jgi:hypothetical protein
VCGREGPESPELPLREPPGCLPRVVPGEIKVLPSDGREMAKRLVVDLNAMFPQGRNSAIQVNCIPQNDGSHDQG